MSDRELDRDGTDAQNVIHPDHPWESARHPLYLPERDRHKGNWPPVTAESMIAHGSVEVKYWASLPDDPAKTSLKTSLKTSPKHADEPRRPKKQFVQARINMKRVLAIGEELAQITSAVDHLATAYTNRDLRNGRSQFENSELFAKLNERRTALREELRKMG